ncbi:MAG: putative NEDD8-conjugating enzyme Ubc12 [Streblomastix strix]|uniref:Putative NEDD8-conjugating enzyme Ubc12 n=1 Tax=Streblomastix strix TaxID=222440 RepID=A0A5J4WRG8_9EUKA|nr:MAG: putative NEDD8-conjugating enzyme Ubc12 [Streblomastix strix]
MMKLAEERKQNQETQQSQQRFDGRLSPRSLQITHDLGNLNLPDGVKLRFPNKDNIREMEFLISPSEGYWKGGNFLFRVSFPEDYKFSPPNVHCLTKVYHPFILEDGQVDMGLLRIDRNQGWTPSKGIQDLTFSLIIFLFIETPPTDSCTRCGAMMRNDHEQFLLNVAASFRGEVVDGQQYERQPIEYGFPGSNQTTQ